MVSGTKITPATKAFPDAKWLFMLKAKALEDIPREGQVFTLDGEPMLVSNCVDDLGIMSITLHQNVGVGGGMDAY